MNNESGIGDARHGRDCRKTLSLLVWLAVSTGWLVSIFSVIQDMCLATACRDAALYTIFGFNLGWFGIAYFSLIMMLQWLRKKVCWLDRLFYTLVSVGIGAELRLLWIQKYIIGSWCPLCVTICCALFTTALLLLIENRTAPESARSGGKRLLWQLAFFATMVATGLAIAIAGVQELT